MKILVRKSDNMVIDAGINIAIVKTGIMVDKIFYAGFKQDDFQIITVGDIPADFRGGKYLYITDSFVLNADYKSPSIVFEKAKNAIISKLDFFSRITDQELGGICDAAKQNSVIQVMIDKCKVSDYIDLNDKRLIEGISSLEALGLIAAGRAKEILCQDI